MLPIRSGRSRSLDGQGIQVRWRRFRISGRPDAHASAGLLQRGAARGGSSRAIRLGEKHAQDPVAVAAGDAFLLELPLDTEAERAARHLDRLDDAVGGTCGHADARPSVAMDWWW